MRREALMFWFAEEKQSWSWLNLHFFRERNDQDGNSRIKLNADGTVMVRGDRRVVFLVS